MGVRMRSGRAIRAFYDVRGEHRRARQSGGGGGEEGLETKRVRRRAARPFRGEMYGPEQQRREFARPRRDRI